MGVPEAVADPDLAIWMPGGLGDAEALFPCSEGLGELTQFGQDRRQEPAGEHRRQPRQPEALGERRALEEGDSRAHRLGRPARVAGEPERRAELVVRDDAQPEVADRLGDGARAVRRVDRPSVLAKEGVEDRLVPKYPPKPPLVTEPLRQRACLVQHLAHPRELAERPEGAPLLEAQVDELLGPLPAVWQLVEGDPCLLEVGEGVPGGRAVERPDPRLPAVLDRLVPHLPAKRVVRQPLHLFTQPVRVEPLHRRHDLGVKLATAVLEQAPVGDLVRERVLEGVLQVREELRLVVRDRRQERVGHVLADHRGRLQELLLLVRQPVDPRCQDRLHRRRDLQRLHRPCQMVCSPLSYQRSRLHQRPHRLLQEERVAPLHQHLRQGRKPGVRPEEHRQQLRRALGGQAVEPEVTVGGLAPPAVLVLGAVADQEQEARGAQALHQAVQ